MSDGSPRLPLPGEKPVTVYQPGKHRTRHPWLRVHRGMPLIVWRMAPWLLVMALVYAGLRAWRATSVPVVLVINGQPQNINTHRRTVGRVVRAAGVRPDSTLYLDPPAEMRIEQDTVITVASRRPVIISADGQITVFSSHQFNPADIAAEAGIPVEDADSVQLQRAIHPTGPKISQNPALAEAQAIPREIRIVHPVRIVVEQHGERVAFDTVAPTIGQALSEAGYVLHEADRVDPPLWTPPDPEGTIVKIEQAIPLVVRADGHTRTIHTHQPTVGEVLTELGLALVEGDYATPPVDSPVEPGSTVRIVRVTEEVLAEREPLAFETIYIPDPDIVLDQEMVIQEGQPGEIERRVRVRHEDGIEVSRAQEGEWVVTAPRSEIVAYGTKIVIRELRTSEGILRYWRHLRVLATSYSPANADYRKKPGDPWYGITATGAVVRQGVVAVDPSVINLYTRMYIDGYGRGQALDIGGAIQGYRIDLGYTDEDLEMWNGWVDVYLLTPVPPTDQIIWRLP